MAKSPTINKVILPSCFSGMGHSCLFSRGSSPLDNVAGIGAGLILLLLMSVSLLGIAVTLLRLLVAVTVAVALLSVSEQLG